MDLARVVDLDANRDGQVLWADLLARQSEIIAYLKPHVQVASAAHTCQLNWRLAGLTRHSDGNYLAMEFRPDCLGTEASASQLTYTLFFDEDPWHRSLVMLRIGAVEQLTVLSPARTELGLGAMSSLWATAGIFVWEGMVQLWIGYDHILFLLALMLPAAVRRKGGRWAILGLGADACCVT